MTELLGLIGAIVGFVVGRWYELGAARARIDARLQALRAEIQECARRGEELRHVSPLSTVGFTLPNWIGRETVGQLSADGVLTEEEARILVGFFALVADINSNVEYARTANDTGREVRGTQLAVQKAGHLFDQTDGVTRVQRVEGVVSRILDDVHRWHWWQPFIVRKRPRS